MRSLKMHLINEISLDLTWSKHYVISIFVARIPSKGGHAVNAATGATFTITATKIYVPDIAL